VVMLVYFLTPVFFKASFDALKPICIPKHVKTS